MLKTVKNGIWLAKA